VADTAEPEKLIPTMRRDKLRRGRSYAVGAEAISEALAGVPLFEVLSISLRGEAWVEGTLSATYDGTARTWQIEVGSVPSEMRSAVRNYLVATGLPGLRAWLLAPRAETWYDRDHRFRFRCWGKEPQSSAEEFEKARNEIHWPISPVRRFAE
jgi:hypothetical protein